MRQPTLGRRLESRANLSTRSSRNFYWGCVTYVPDSCASFILSSSASTGSGHYYYRRFIGEERLGDLSNLPKVMRFSGELNLGPFNNKKQRFKHFGPSVPCAVKWDGLYGRVQIPAGYTQESPWIPFPELAL